MQRKTVSTIMLSLLVISTFILAFEIQGVKADGGTIYIRADGSIDPPTAPIGRNGNVYTLTADIVNNNIYIQKNDTVFDGSGHSLTGPGETTTTITAGINLTQTSNVVVKNLRIAQFVCGIAVSNSANDSLVGNNITENGLMTDPTYGLTCEAPGIIVSFSQNNLITGNYITNNTIGLEVGFSSYNNITDNNVSDNNLGPSSYNYNGIGIMVVSSSNNFITSNELIYNWGGGGAAVILLSSNNPIYPNTSPTGNEISQNDMLDNYYAIAGENATSNKIYENNMTSNCFGILFDSGSDNLVYHNDFVDSWGSLIYNQYNETQAVSINSTNIWDNGYPSGGNYWSDYEQRYPNAQEIGNSGLWNTPYVIDANYANNTDNYPLVSYCEAAPPPTYLVVFTETGLPQGVQWSVTFNNQPQSATVNYGVLIHLSSIIFYAMKGAYSYTIAVPPGYTTSDPTSGPINVDGQNVSAPLVNFTLDPSEIKTDWGISTDSYNVSNPFSTWATEGNCFGMSSTALMYFMHYTLGNASYPYLPSQSPAAEHTSDLDLNVTYRWYDPIDPHLDSLNNASLAVTFNQVYIMPHFPVKGPIDPSYYEEWENQQFMTLLANLTAGDPVVLNLMELSSKKAHSVVAVGAKPETVNGVPTGRVDIYVYSPTYPETTQTAYYDTNTGSFSYTESFYGFSPTTYDFFNVIENTSGMLPPKITKGYYTDPWGDPLSRDNWLLFSVPDYTIVIADTPVTIIALRSGLEDNFNEWGNSQSFVCGIPSSSGIEEGDVQVYAIPDTIAVRVKDPGPGNSGLLITRVTNESGELLGNAYLINAATTSGSLDFSVTPSDLGLSIGAGNNSLNTNVTFFSATQQGYSASDVLTAQIDAGQNVSLTAPCLASLTASKNVVGKGYAIPVNVTITNVGNNPENVTLTLYANSTTLNSETVFNLLNGTSTTLACVGNTSSCAYGNYTLSAYCEPNGINEAANNFTYTGSVTVTIPGDLDGYFNVTLADLVQFASAYGTTPASGGIPGVLHAWNPNADINGDLRVDVRDLVILANHYGQHYP